MSAIAEIISTPLGNPDIGPGIAALHTAAARLHWLALEADGRAKCEALRGFAAARALDQLAAHSLRLAAGHLREWATEFEADATEPFTPVIVAFDAAEPPAPVVAVPTATHCLERQAATFERQAREEVRCQWPSIPLGYAADAAAIRYALAVLEADYAVEMNHQPSPDLAA